MKKFWLNKFNQIKMSENKYSTNGSFFKKLAQKSVLDSIPKSNNISFVLTNDSIAYVFQSNFF